jgi:hypothetical protein
LQFGENAAPGQLANIFKLLDNLIVNVRKVGTDYEQRGLGNRRYNIVTPGKSEAEKPGFPLAQNIVSFLGKVKTFVRHLKREIIYTQSEQTIRYYLNFANKSKCGN